MNRYALTLCVLVAACSEPSSAPPPSAAPALGPAPTPAPTPAKPSAAAVPDIAEARVRALLERWLGAQNSGDFAAYSALYAERFSGIKRVGTRSTRTCF